MRPQDEHIQTIKLLIETDVEGALRYLNGLTRFRFSGLYFFNSGTAKNWYFVDRESEAVDDRLLSIPLSDTYCAFVLARSKPFVTSDALADERLLHHPARSAVRSYCGSPLLDEFGNVVGSICHFDMAPMLPHEHDLEADEGLLQILGPMFANKLSDARAMASHGPWR